MYNQRRVWSFYPTMQCARLTNCSTFLLPLGFKYNQSGLQVISVYYFKYLSKWFSWHIFNRNHNCLTYVAKKTCEIISRNKVYFSSLSLFERFAVVVCYVRAQMDEDDYVTIWRREEDQKSVKVNPLSLSHPSFSSANSGRIVYNECSGENPASFHFMVDVWNRQGHVVRVLFVLLYVV